jgi:hypothetical protein
VGVVVGTDWTVHVLPPFVVAAIWPGGLDSVFA